MAAFLVIDETTLGGTLPVAAGSMSLGRAEDNDVTIPHGTVSAHHARIITYFEVSYIEDLGSTNGTFVNGKRVERHTLHDGDQVRLGGYTLAFRQPGRRQDSEQSAHAVG